MKRCPLCGETDLTRFGRNRSRKDKLTTYCLTCKNKKGLENYYHHRDKRIAAQREQRTQEPERFRGYRRTYYRRHREERNAHNRLWKERNPEKVRMYYRRRRAKPEHNAYRRAYEKQWRQTPGRKAYMQVYQRAYYRNTRRLEGATNEEESGTPRLKPGACETASAKQSPD